MAFGYELGCMVKRSLGQIALLVALPACAPSLAGDISGVLDSDDLSTGSVNVVRLDTDDPSAVIVPINRNGKFRLEDKLVPGRYLVEVLMPGYRISSQEVQLPREEGMAFELTKIVGTKSKTIGVNMEIDASRGSGNASLTPPRL